MKGGKRAGERPLQREDSRKGGRTENITNPKKFVRSKKEVALGVVRSGKEG